MRPLAAGAARDPIEIVDVEDVPLAYLPGNATRIRVKAVESSMPVEGYLLKEEDLVPLSMGAALREPAAGEILTSACSGRAN